MNDKFQVDISPDARELLCYWVDKCNEDNGYAVASELLDAFENVIKTLEMIPESGTGALKYIPEKYRAICLWKHLWLIYQIWYRDGIVKIEYLIDDRQNYKVFVK